MREDTTRQGAIIADGEVTSDLPMSQAGLLQSAPEVERPPHWAAPEPEVWRAPLLDRLDGVDVRSWALVGSGVLAGAMLMAVLFVVLGSGSGQVAQVGSTGLDDVEVAQLADPADGALPADTVPTTDQVGAPSTAAIESTSSSSTTSTSLTTTSSTTTTVATTAPTTSTPPSTESTAAPTSAPTTVATSASSETTQPPVTESSTTTTTTAPPTTAPPVTGPSGGDAAVQQAVLDATNAARAEAGCPPLRLDPALNAAADGHSEDMAARVYFDHTSPEGGTPGDRVRAAGYPGRGVAENIAVGQRSPEEVVQGWMNSPGHRANILTCSFQDLGVGYAEGERNDRIPGRYWTQVFSSR